MGLRDQNNGKKIGISGPRIYHVTTLCIYFELCHFKIKIAKFACKYLTTDMIMKHLKTVGPLDCHGAGNSSHIPHNRSAVNDHEQRLVA